MVAERSNSGRDRGLGPRSGVIIECPLNGQFHEANTVILTAQNDVREMVDHHHYHEQMLFYL